MAAMIDTALAGTPPVVPVPSSIEWEPHLPPALLYVWENFGRLTLADGRLRLIDPRALKPFIALLTQDDADFSGDTHAIALGNLGEVVIYSERHGVGLLTWPLSTLQMTYMMDANPPSPDEQILTEVLKMPAQVLDTTDPTGDPVHDKLVARLGPLDEMQIYGATPVPPEPGGTPAEHYVLADAQEWLEANYTEIAVDIVDWTRTPATLKTMGLPWPNGAPRHLPKARP